MVIDMKQLNDSVKFKKNLSKAEVERVAKGVKRLADVNGEIWGSYHMHEGVKTSSYAMVMYECLYISHEVDYDEVALTVNHVAITTDDAIVFVCNDEDGEQYMIELEADDLREIFWTHC